MPDNSRDSDKAGSDNHSQQIHDGHGVRYATLAATASHFLDVHSGALVPAIQPSTTFARDDQYQLINPAHGYARDDSPTYLAAERTLCDLENAYECCLFSSGMAAIAAVIGSIGGTVGGAGHVLVPASVYWGVNAWLDNHVANTGARISRYDNARPDSIGERLMEFKDNGDKVDLLCIETPANPLLYVTDIKAAAQLAHEVGAMVCVDSTTATPVLTRPLDYVADLVVHSATKYLNGHGDALAGAVLTREDSPLWQSIRLHRGFAGSVPGNLEAWLLSRGMRTVYLRVEKASANAMHIANMLESRQEVSVVHYPGLSSHAGHATATQQMSGGYGGLLSFEIKAGKEAALRFAGALNIISSATSLGGTETLIEHRASVEPPGSGVPEGLLRLSVGIEHVEDLVNDLKQAFNNI